MSEEIIKVLDNLGEKFGIAIDWTSQNVMPYIQELMNRYRSYFITSCVIWLVLELILLVISIVVFRGGLKEKKKDRYWRWDEEGLYRTIFLITSTIILGIALPITIQMLLKGIYMPEFIFINAIGGIK